MAVYSVPSHDIWKFRYLQLIIAEHSQWLVGLSQNCVNAYSVISVLCVDISVRLHFKFGLWLISITSECIDVRMKYNHTLAWKDNCKETAKITLFRFLCVECASWLLRQCWRSGESPLVRAGFNYFTAILYKYHCSAFPHPHFDTTVPK